MVRAYSNDLREGVARSMVAGRSARETGRLFGLSVASVVKWSQRLRTTGTAASRPMGGHRKRILASEQPWMLARLATQPDLTVRALAVELKDRGFEVSPAARKARQARMFSGVQVARAHPVVNRVGRSTCTDVQV